MIFWKNYFEKKSNNELLKKYIVAIYEEDMPTAYNCINEGVDIEQSRLVSVSFFQPGLNRKLGGG